MKWFDDSRLGAALPAFVHPRVSLAATTGGVWKPDALLDGTGIVRVGQVARLREELEGSRFGMAQTLEVLQRTWHVEGQAVRPDHRMVAHTGFLTSARLLGEIPGGLKPPRLQS